MICSYLRETSLCSTFSFCSPHRTPSFLKKKKGLEYKPGRNKNVIIFYQLRSSDYLFVCLFIFSQMLINRFPKYEVDFHTRFFAGLSRPTEQLHKRTFHIRNCALVSLKKVFPLYFWFASEGICKKPAEHL